MSSENHGQPIPADNQEEVRPAGTAPSEEEPSPEAAAEATAQQDGGLESRSPTAESVESVPVAPGDDPEAGGDANQAEAGEGRSQPLPANPGQSVEERVSNLERRQGEAKEEAEPPLSASGDLSLEERVTKLEQWQAATDEQLKQQQQQLEEKDNQIMRRAAEFDNFRRRNEQEKDKLKTRYTCAALREMLPIVDSFEMARKELSPEKLDTLDPSEVHHNYQQVYKQLVTALKKLNVSPMNAKGQIFDPALHEAVMREPSQEYEEDLVMEELQRGYHLEGEVLRHAMVKVSMGPGPDDHPPVDPG